MDDDDDFATPPRSTRCPRDAPRSPHERSGRPGAPRRTRRRAPLQTPVGRQARRRRLRHSIGGARPGRGRAGRCALAADLVPRRAVSAVSLAAGTGRVTVTIPRDAGARHGRQDPRARRRDLLGLLLRAARDAGGDRSNLRSGTYHLRRDMSYGDVAEDPDHGAARRQGERLTIVEGKTRSQIDALLRSQGVRGSYLAATRRSPLLDPRRYGAPRSNQHARGLPVPRHLPAARADQDRRRWSPTSSRRSASSSAKVNLGYARSKHLTPFDVLTIASLVQAEARDGARPPADRVGDLQPAAPAGCRCRSTRPRGTRPATTPSR